MKIEAKWGRSGQGPSNPMKEQRGWLGGCSKPQIADMNPIDILKPERAMLSGDLRLTPKSLSV
jgi:hypothetical protein